MSADAEGGARSQRARGGSLARISRIQEANWNALANLAKRQFQIAVVGHHDHRSNSAVEHIEQGVSSEVHVAALLLPVGDARHEFGLMEILASVLDPDRHGGVDDLGARGAPWLDSQRTVNQLLEVVAPFDPVIRASGAQSTYICVLVGIPGTGGAIDKSAECRACPGRLSRGYASQVPGRGVTRRLDRRLLKLR